MQLSVKKASPKLASVSVEVVQVSDVSLPVSDSAPPPPVGLSATSPAHAEKQQETERTTSNNSLRHLADDLSLPSRARCWLARLSWLRLEAAIAKPDYRQVGQFISYAADWSPGPNKADALRWPADLQSGEIKPIEFAKWQQRSPAHFIADPQQVATIRERFNGRIHLSVGKNDEFGLHPPTVAFSQALDEAKINHTLVVGEGTHGSGQNERLRKAFEFALSVFAKDAVGSQ